MTKDTPVINNYLPWNILERDYHASCTSEDWILQLFNVSLVSVHPLRGTWSYKTYAQMDRQGDSYISTQKLAMNLLVFLFQFGYQFSLGLVCIEGKVHLSWAPWLKYTMFKIMFVTKFQYSKVPFLRLLNIKTGLLLRPFFLSQTHLFTLHGYHNKYQFTIKTNFCESLRWSY